MISIIYFLHSPESQLNLYFVSSYLSPILSSHDARSMSVNRAVKVSPHGRGQNDFGGGRNSRDQDVRLCVCARPHKDSFRPAAVKNGENTHKHSSRLDHSAKRFAPTMTSLLQQLVPPLIAAMRLIVFAFCAFKSKQQNVTEYTQKEFLYLKKKNNRLSRLVDSYGASNYFFSSSEEEPKVLIFDGLNYS